jgi:hypothetical protein
MYHLSHGIFLSSIQCPFNDFSAPTENIVMTSTKRSDGNLPTRPHGDMSSAKRKFKAQTTNLKTCDKDDESRARNREYQRNYRARQRAKVDGIQNKQPDASAIINKV